MFSPHSSREDGGGGFPRLRTPPLTLLPKPQTPLGGSTGKKKCGQYESTEVSGVWRYVGFGVWCEQYDNLAIWREGTHAHAHNLFLALSLFRSLSFSLTLHLPSFLFLSLSLTLSRSHTLSLTHTLAHTRTHTQIGHYFQPLDA